MANISGDNLVKIGGEAEALVASNLREMGYCVGPPDNHHYDLLCEGVKIEVKIAYPVDGQWVWAFNGRKRFADHCDIVVLVGKHLRQAEFSYFIFPADHAVFFCKSGEPKAGIGITIKMLPARYLRKTRKQMELYRDGWYLIEQAIGAHKRMEEAKSEYRKRLQFIKAEAGGATLLTINEAAEQVELSGNAISQAISRNRLKARKIEGMYYVKLADIETYLQSRWHKEIKHMTDIPLAELVKDEIKGDGFIRVAQAARLMGLDPMVLYKAASRGRIEVQKSGKSSYTTLTDVQNYLASRWRRA